MNSVEPEPPPAQAPDAEVLASVRRVLAAVIRATAQADLTADKVRAMAEVLEGQVKVLREVAG